MAERNVDDAYIDLNNRAKARDRKCRSAPTKAELRARWRKREIERWLLGEYGRPLPDDDHGREDFAILVNEIVQAGLRDPGATANAAASAWAPWLAAGEVEQLIGREATRFQADELADQLGVTLAQRIEYGFKTIGACDVSRAQRDEAMKQRKLDLQRERRQRKPGWKPRPEYEGNSISRAKPWKADGTSKPTWYRDRAKAEGDDRSVKRTRKLTSETGVKLIRSQTSETGMKHIRSETSVKQIERSSIDELHTRLTTKPRRPQKKSHA
jgi:hypothetical protein